MVEMSTIVKASVDVIHITKLKQGDVIKLIDINNGYDPIKFAIVTALYNDGNKTAVEVLSFKLSSYELVKEQKLLTEDTKYLIHPSSQAELETMLKDNLVYLEKSFDEKVRELDNRKQSLELARSIVNGTYAQSLSTPEFNVLDQHSLQHVVEQE